MYDREKLTIKGRASRRVFPSKNALRTKRPVFYSPGEFTGRGSETHLHKIENGGRWETRTLDLIRVKDAF